MAGFFGKEDDVVVDPDLSIVLVIVGKAEFFVTHKVAVLDEPDEGLDHLRVLVNRSA